MYYKEFNVRIKKLRYQKYIYIFFLINRWNHKKNPSEFELNNYRMGHKVLLR